MFDYAHGWLNGRLGGGMPSEPLIGVLVVVLLVVVIFKVANR